MIKSKKYTEIIKNNNVWFSNPSDVQYLTKFKASFMEVFFINGKWFALTDSRYIISAKKQIKNMEVKLFRDFFFKEIIPLIKKTNSILVVDSTHLTIERFENIQKKLDKNKIKLLPLSFKGLREIKNSSELEIIKEAVKITDDIFSDILKYIEIDQTEKEITNFILKKVIDLGYETSFYPIVAAGINGSSPHHKGGNYKIKDKDLVTIDFGIFYKGLASDMTRTIAIGSSPSDEQKKIHNIVLKAMELGISKTKPGIKACEVDKVVRDYIKQEGYEDNFNHGTGHGLGYEVHEEPSISPNSDKILEEGMVITIEPGIYLENNYGVRIEQDIIITSTGCEQLNKSTKELLIINNEK